MAADRANSCERYYNVNMQVTISKHVCLGVGTEFDASLHRGLQSFHYKETAMTYFNVYLRHTDRFVVFFKLQKRRVSGEI